jgi:hypothetical protein
VAQPVPPRARQQPRPEIEAVPPDAYRDAGTSALIGAIAPPPPSPMVRMTEPRCPTDSDVGAGSLAWIFAGLATAAAVLSTSWGVQQARRAKIIREELSRIRIHRTSLIRGNNRPLGEVQMPPHGLGKRPDPAPASDDYQPAEGQRPPQPGPKVPLSAPQSPGAATPSAASGGGGDEAASARVREEAESRLAMAQAELEPLLAVSRSVEEWFRGPEFEAILAAAGDRRAFFDRLRRGVVSASATFHALRFWHVFPSSGTAIDVELERYWEQVYESLDDVFRLLGAGASDEGRSAVVGIARTEGIKAQLDRLVEAARAYLASDGRRPIPIEPLHTDFDRRIHQAVDGRKVPGVPPGKILSVSRVGIVREGRLVRKPEVVQSL